MALRSNKKSIIVHVDPLTFNAEIEVLGGNNVQTFNRETQEYEPDRTLVPLVLMPSVVVQDPHSVQNGLQELTSVEWYEGAPLADASNRISAGTDYEIGDGTAGGFPKYALKCRKNVNPNTPMEIYAIAVFIDRRRNTEIKVERHIPVYTAYYDAQNFSVKLDKPETWNINPLTVVPDAEGYWKHTVTAQLYSGKNPVDDARAAYWWEVFEDGAWRAVNDDDLSVWLDCKDAEGNFTRTLTFDARMVPGNVAFRARAAFVESERPAAPKSEELVAATSVSVSMPRTLQVDVVQTKGARMGITMDTPVAYEAVISDNHDIVPASKDKLFRIHWYGRSEKPGYRNVLLGTGRSIEFTPKDKGFDKNYPVNVYASVEFYSGHALAVSKGESDTDPSVVTVNGIPVIVPVYV